MSTKNKTAPLPGGGRNCREFSQYAAILVFVGLAVLLCAAVRYGIQNDDETTCIAGAHRMLFGDLPLIKNWTVIQLNSFLTYLPFRLLYTVLGGTEGIVLAFRYVYVAVKMIFFAGICVAFRRYRWWAILAAVVFTVFHPLDFLSLTYYNLNVFFAFAVGVVLFVLQKRSAPALILAGMLFACCVLAEPPMVLIYAAFTVAVPIRYLLRNKRKRSFSDAVLSPDLRTWGLLTAGIVLVAAVVFAIVLSAADLKTVLKSAPGVLRNLEFRPQSNQWQKYADYIMKTGVAVNVAAGGVLALTVVLSAAKKLQKAHGLLFAAACLVFVWMTAEMFFRGGVILSAVYLVDFKPIPLCFLGLVSFLLAEKKDRCLFAFFLFGLACAVCMDLLSRISVGVGGVISAPAAVLLFRQTLLERLEVFRAQTSEGEKRRFLPRQAGLTFVSVCTLLALTVSETVYGFYALRFPMPEAMTGQALPETIDRGPLAGLKTTPMLKEKYDAVISDMDRLKETGPTSLYVMHFCEWCNLYLDLPYATFTPNSFDTEKSLEVQLYYWNLHPDTKPDAVYIPFFGCDNYDADISAAEKKLAFIRSVADCSVETGEAGFLITALHWKEPVR